MDGPAAKRHPTLGDPHAVRALLEIVGTVREQRPQMAVSPKQMPAVRAKPPILEVERTPAAIRALRDEGIIGVLAGRR
ncbi:MAG: hypothetical protein AAFW98_19080 [Pseudomonadota bacterium]